MRKFLSIDSYRDTILLLTRHSQPTRMDESVSRTFRRPRRFCTKMRWLVAMCLVCVLSWALFPSTVSAQDWVKTGTSLGVEKVRLAVPDFKPSTAEPQNTALLKT